MPDNPFAKAARAVSKRQAAMAQATVTPKVGFRKGTRKAYARQLAAQRKL